jgi:hypothetical protein
MVYIEGVEDVWLEEPADTRRIVGIFEELVAMSLTAHASMEKIRALLTERRNGTNDSG